MAVIAEVFTVPGYGYVIYAFAAACPEYSRCGGYAEDWPMTIFGYGTYYTVMSPATDDNNQSMPLEPCIPYVYKANIALNSWINDNYKKRLDPTESLADWLGRRYEPRLFINAGD